MMNRFSSSSFKKIKKKLITAGNILDRVVSMICAVAYPECASPACSLETEGDLTMRQMTSLLATMCVFAVIGCTQPVATKSTKVAPKATIEASKPEAEPSKPADKPADKPAEKPADKPGDKTPPK
jgi:hypothetical protein